MKNLIKAITATCLVLFTVVNISTAKNNSIVTIYSENTSSTFDKIYESYFQLKDALVASNTEMAKEKANELNALVAAMQTMNMSPEIKSSWTKVSKSLSENVEKIAKAKAINEQRTHFAALSTNVYDLIKSDKTSTTMYYAYCPMANKGKGGSWLSLEKDIKNPFYGQSMLKCGSVKETIN